MKEKASKKVVSCNQCGKPAITMYAEKIPLCVDCYKKVAQANFMEQQARHNQLSWLASQINLTEQQLHQGMGGILPLKQMEIPQPPSAGINYSYSNIQVSDSAIGVINPGTLYTINTSIDVIQNRGDTKLATIIKDLTQEVANSKEIEDDIRKEIAELLEFMASQAVASSENRNKSVISQVMERIGKLVPVATTLWSIWEKAQPYLQSYLGV